MAELPTSSTCTLVDPVSDAAKRTGSAKLLPLSPEQVQNSGGAAASAEIAVGQEVHVVRKNGQWSSGVIADVHGDAATVRLEDGSSKDVPVSEVYGRIRLLRSIQSLHVISLGEAVHVKRSSGYWTMGAIAEESASTLQIRFLDGSLKDVPKDAMISNIRFLQWKQCLQTCQTEENGSKLRCGQAVQVLRKDGSWSLGTITKTISNTITVTLDNGARKDIPADSAHAQVKLLHQVKHLSSGQAVLVKRSNGSWTMGVVAEEKDEVVKVALEDGSYKEISRDVAHKQVRPFQWSQAMKPAVETSQQGYVGTQAVDAIALAAYVAEGVNASPRDGSGDESEVDPFTTALKETVPRERPPSEEKTERTVPDTEARFAVPREEETECVVVPDNQAIFTVPREPPPREEDTERAVPDTEAIPSTQELGVQDNTPAQRMGRILATGQTGQILISDPSDVDLAWKLRVGDRDDWFPAHAVEEIVVQ